MHSGPTVLYLFPQAKNMPVHRFGPACLPAMSGITSDEDTSETELGTSHPRRQLRPAKYTKHPPSTSPLHDIHKPADINPPPNLTPLELAQFTAQHVAHSTGKAVEKLALQKFQGGASIPGERGPDDHHQRLKSGGSDHVTVNITQQGGHIISDDSSDILATRNISSIHAMPEDWTTERSPPGQSKEGSSYSKVEPSTESARIQYSDQFLHNPARIHYPEGSSPAEKAAYAAEIVAGSTSTAVQKLSGSLTEKSTFFSSGFSGAADGLGSPVL